MAETIEKQKIVTELFQAYFDARKNKRNTINALIFEKYFETNLFDLYDEIIENKYEPGPSICFVVNKPVKREIFAADFRDRVVHHFIINKINSLFEKLFIYDSYACRIGKGTHLGIRRVDRFIRRCSRNYSTDCYILKLDIKGFFMHIVKNILYEKLSAFIHQKYQQSDKALVLELCWKVIYNDPANNCIIKGERNNWGGLPPDKSLFHSPPGCGLPIGNLTSQVFANFYLNSFDHFVKNDLGIRFYGRYVDDFVLVHRDKDYLKSLIPVLSDFLLSTLKLSLHPDKIYLQHYSKGVQYLGAVIKPYRICIANRTKGNFYGTIEKQNRIVRDHKPAKEELAAFLSSMNSYLGIMKHYKTYTLRKLMLLEYLSGWWWNYVYLSGGFAKFVMKQKSASSNW
jgi:retron-type reverse transcriptase